MIPYLSYVRTVLDCTKRPLFERTCVDIRVPRGVPPLADAALSVPQQLFQR